MGFKSLARPWRTPSISSLPTRGLLVPRPRIENRERLLAASWAPTVTAFEISSRLLPFEAWALQRGRPALKMTLPYRPVEGIQ